jgi:hypothetical protein
MQKQHNAVKTAKVLVAGFLIVAAGTLTLLKQAEAHSGCHKINTILTSVADFTTFSTEGKIKSGILKGSTKLIGDPLSLTPINSTVSPPIKPQTFSYTGDLHITTKKGTLTTRSVGMFESIPLGLGTQFDRVISGTGVFVGATGFLYLNFEAGDAGDTFTSIVTGEVCLE